MAELIVEPVRTGRQRRLFLEFPWTLYRGDPYWIPPLRINQKEGVGYAKNPFYDQNSCQTFLAMRGGEVCGRIAAILNQGHNLRYNERRGFFGFFECRDDQEAANSLLDAARRWFAEQGIYCLRGPTNPSLNYELGLLIDGFDSTPTFMMTYNPPYYERLLENYGLRKTQDLYAFWGHVSMLPKIQQKLGPVADQIIERYDVRCRPLDRKHFLDDVRTFLSIYNRSLTNTWGFVPMSPEEVTHLAKGLQHLIVPELSVAAEMDGKVVGVSFGLLDYNPRIREIDGRLFPFGFIRLLRNKRAIKRIRLISTNVLPEYQRLGIGMVLMSGILPHAMDWGMEEAEFSWVLESNSLSRGALKKGGAKITKTYRLYDLDEPAPAAGQRSRLAAPRPQFQGRLEICPVQNARDLDRFCQVPWKIYADDPHWVPPLLVEVKEFLDRRKHPFYRHGDAAQFLALRDGQPAGRILVSDDSRYNHEHPASTGCFGMFESADDPEMAAGLLDAAAGWLRGRGRTSVLGPIDYSTNYASGLLVDGFDTPPRIMCNHHRPYYAELLEAWGLTKQKDFYCWWFADPNNMLDQWKARAERVLRRGRIVVRPFRRDDFQAEVDRCLAIYNESMRANWGFVSFSDEEFKFLADRLAKLAITDLVLLAEVDGKPVGFSITLPDINEAIRPLNGRLTRFGLPINLLRFMRRKRRIRNARMIVLDVLERYRRRGIAELLILRTLDYGKNVMGYRGAELGWTLEDNDPINRTIEAVGGRRYKTYRIYGKPLASDAAKP